MMIFSSTISHNYAARAGGGLTSLGDAVLLNTTFSENTISSGQSQNLQHDFGVITVTNSTLYHTQGIGVYLGIFGQLVIGNTIVAGPPGSFNCEIEGTLISIGYNLDSSFACDFYGPGDLINSDPLLGPLQANGGSTWTHALPPDSPAIDAGNPGCSGVDQRGVPRPQDGNEDGTPVCDIGAYEFEPDEPTATPTPTATPISPPIEQLLYLPLVCGDAAP
jgi:hypothetical protein